jgi:hypothetical protein
LSEQYGGIIYRHELLSQEGFLIFDKRRSISNTISTLPGIFGVMLTGFILQITDQNWSIVFTSVAVLSLSSVFIYSVRDLDLILVNLSF